MHYSPVLPHMIAQGPHSAEERTLIYTHTGCWAVERRISCAAGFWAGEGRQANGAI